MRSAPAELLRYRLPQLGAVLARAHRQRARDPVLAVLRVGAQGRVERVVVVHPAVVRDALPAASRRPSRTARAPCAGSRRSEEKSPVSVSLVITSPSCARLHERFSTFVTLLSIAGWSKQVPGLSTTYGILRPDGADSEESGDGGAGRSASSPPPSGAPWPGSSVPAGADASPDGDERGRFEAAADGASPAALSPPPSSSFAPRRTAPTTTARPTATPVTSAAVLERPVPGGGGAGGRAPGKAPGGRAPGGGPKPPGSAGGPDCPAVPAGAGRSAVRSPLAAAVPASEAAAVPAVTVAVAAAPAVAAAADQTPRYFQAGWGHSTAAETSCPKHAPSPPYSDHRARPFQQARGAPARTCRMVA